MELFTETNGQILSLIINSIVIFIFNNKYMKKDASTVYFIFLILSSFDVFLNTLMLGYTFEFIHQFIYLLFRFSFLNLLLMIADIFIICIFIIAYMILMVCNVEFIQAFYGDYNNEQYREDK